MYAKVIDNQIQTIKNLKDKYPNTSFPRPLPTKHDGWKKVIDNGGTDEQKKGNIIQQDEEFVQTYVIDRDRITAHLSTYRDKRLNEGITVSGVSIGTDDLTQQRIMAARIIAKEDNTYTVNWKTNSGFVTLNAAQIIGIADSIRAHVQKCFDAESTIDPADYDTIQALEGAFDDAYSE